ncbi:hypothetical protein B0H14DRAFT_2836841, partial [Mycena olivaceomarginata]
MSQVTEQGMLSLKSTAAFASISNIFCNDNVVNNLIIFNSTLLWPFTVSGWLSPNHDAVALLSATCSTARSTSTRGRCSPSPAAFFAHTRATTIDCAAATVSASPTLPSWPTRALRPSSAPLHLPPLDALSGYAPCARPGAITAFDRCVAPGLHPPHDSTTFPSTIRICSTRSGRSSHPPPPGSASRPPSTF